MLHLAEKKMLAVTSVSKKGRGTYYLPDLATDMFPCLFVIVII